MKQALILFTRVPQAGKTKTRLLRALTPEQCADAHRAFLLDEAESCRDERWELLLFCGTEGPVSQLQALLPWQKRFALQEGSSLGEKMDRAIRKTLQMGYDRCILVGADLPELNRERIAAGFAALDRADVVLGPTADGGYYLVGCKAPCSRIFEQQAYGTGSVFAQTRQAAVRAGMTVQTVPGLCDVDEPEDLQALEQRLTQAPDTVCPHTRQFLTALKRRNQSILDWKQFVLPEAQARLCTSLGIPGEPELTLLGQGEYNLNALLIHPVTGQKLVLRRTTGSQMHLEDQIGYEYRALELLQDSGRTPKPLYLDSGAGLLVEEFLPGRPLDYQKDLPGAAECLAAIHSVGVAESCPLLRPADPVAAMLEECRNMAAVYLTCPAADEAVCVRIRELLTLAEHRAPSAELLPCCILNTELNSGNFLVDGTFVRLVDWEKPILGEPAQDLGHFLAPTTTLWKTEIRLSEAEKEQFLRHYCSHMRDPVSFDQLLARTELYEAVNCLRGITWSAMAWVEYQNPDRPIRNEDTRRKIESYLRPDFLEEIRRGYFAG